MAKGTKTPNVFAKPPNYCEAELNERRKRIGAGLMVCYATYGWKQPIGDEWLLMVRGWSAALAFIPTNDLLRSIEDALAQPNAPKPLTPDYVKDVYNGLPDQGLAICSDASHIPFKIAAPINPIRDPLALPAPEGLEPLSDESAAAVRAIQLSKEIEDPELRGVFMSLMAKALIPADRRARNAEGAPLFYDDGRPTEAGRRAGITTNYDEARENGRESRGIGAITREDLPDDLRADLDADARQKAASAPAPAQKQGLSGRDYLEQLRKRADQLPDDVRDGVLNPRRAFQFDEDATEENEGEPNEAGEIRPDDRAEGTGKA